MICYAKNVLLLFIIATLVSADNGGSSDSSECLFCQRDQLD